MTLRDYSIEWDFTHEQFTEALEVGRPIHSLCITEEFLLSRQGRLTPQLLEVIFKKVSEMWTLEGVYLATQMTVVPGRILPLAISPGLQILKVHSGLEISNLQDSELLATTLRQNGLSLKQISLLNIKIRNKPLASLGGKLGWKAPPTPILDPLLQAVPSMECLQIFEITCHESQTNKNGKPYLSQISLGLLCQSLSLKRFNLSNLGLGDKHFMTIAQELSKKEPLLKELILNDNFNTELGIEMIIRMLLDMPNAKISIFQAFQKDNHLSSSCISLMKRVLQRKNTSLVDLLLSASSKTEAYQLVLYEQLNLQGRNLFLDPSSTTEDWIRLLGSVTDDHSMIFYCLRQSRFWWNCIGLGRSLGRPVQSASTKALADSKSTRSNRNRNMGDEDDEGIDPGRLKKALKVLGIPHEFTTKNVDPQNEDMSSNQSDSYLEDLYKQRQYIKEDAREDALEESHKIYERKRKPYYNTEEDNELIFLEIYERILKRKEKSTKEKILIQEDRILKETARVQEINEKAKTLLLEERRAVRRRNKDLPRGKRVTDREAMNESLRNAEAVDQVFVDKLQEEVRDLREAWKAARAKTRSAKDDAELQKDLKEKEAEAFDTWVKKRQQVKEVEANLIKKGGDTDANGGDDDVLTVGDPSNYD